MVLALAKKGKFYIRTMQMDLEAAKNGPPQVREPEPPVTAAAAPEVRPVPPPLPTPPSSELTPPPPPARREPTQPATKILPSTTEKPPGVPAPLAPISQEKFSTQTPPAAKPPVNLPLQETPPEKHPAPPQPVPMPEAEKRPAPPETLPPLTTPRAATPPPPQSQPPQRLPDSVSLPGPSLKIPGMPQRTLQPKEPPTQPQPKPVTVDLKTPVAPYAYELPSAFKTQAPRRKHRMPLRTILITILLVVLLGGGGYAAFLFFTAPPAPTVSIPQEPSPGVSGNINVPPTGGGSTTSTAPSKGIIEADAAEPINLSSGRERDLLLLLSTPLSRARDIAEITRIDIRRDGAPIDMKTFFSTLGVTKPFGLIDNFAGPFDLLIFSQEEGNRYMLIAPLTEGIFSDPTNLAKLKNQLASWDTSITRDLNILLGRVDPSIPTTTDRFNYKGVAVSGLVFRGAADVGAYYAVSEAKAMWLFSASKSGMLVLIDKLSE